MTGVSLQVLQSNSRETVGCPDKNSQVGDVTDNARTGLAFLVVLDECEVRVLDKMRRNGV